MAVTINASTTSGLQLTSDTSGAIKLQNNGVDAVAIDSSGNVVLSGTGNNDIAGTLRFNSGYGSVAPVYGCRAWVNFNGTGTVAIRASGNVSSITDHGTGDYTVNFTTAMPDANYAAVYGGQSQGIVNASYGGGAWGKEGSTYSTTALRVAYQAFGDNQGYTGQVTDITIATVAVFR